MSAPDLYFLDRVPGVGETVGLSLTGADVIIDPTEYVAEGVSGSTGFYLASTTGVMVNTFEIDSTIYTATAINRVTLEHAGGTATGHILTITPTGGGDPQFMFVADDVSGNLDLSIFTITASEPVTFLYGDTISQDQNHRFVACFAAGTRILTPSGYRPVEAFEPGDLISTLDHGPQPCLLRVERQGLHDPGQDGPLAPVFVPRDALGHGQPSRALHLSRQHRVVLRGPGVLAQTGHAEVLVPAKDLCGWNGICLDRMRRSVHFVHLVLDRHEIILAEGMQTESFFLGDRVGAEWPDLLMHAQAQHHPARPFLHGRAAQDLVQRLKTLPRSGNRGRAARLALPA